MQGTGAVFLVPPAGTTLSIQNSIADQAGADTFNRWNQPLASSLVIGGGGTVSLSATPPA